jgi:hypothetical protein
VAPHRGKDVVQLHIDGTEGQEACHQHLGQRRPAGGGGGGGWHQEFVRVAS